MAKAPWEAEPRRWYKAKPPMLLQSYDAASSGGRRNCCKGEAARRRHHGATRPGRRSCYNKPTILRAAVVATARGGDTAANHEHPEAAANLSAPRPLSCCKAVDASCYKGGGRTACDMSCCKGVVGRKLHAVVVDVAMPGRRNWKGGWHAASGGAAKQGALSFIRWSSVLPI